MEQTGCESPRYCHPQNPIYMTWKFTKHDLSCAFQEVIILVSRYKVCHPDGFLWDFLRVIYEKCNALPKGDWQRDVHFDPEGVEVCSIHSYKLPD